MHKVACVLPFALGAVGYTCGGGGAAGWVAGSAGVGICQRGLGM